MANQFRVIDYLSKEGIDYQVLNHRPLTTLQEVNDCTEIPVDAIARAVLLKDNTGLLMAILPASHVLDIAELCRVMSRDLEPVPIEEILNFFHPSSFNYVPPLPKVYGMSAIIDSKISNCDKLYIEPGENNKIIELAGEDFLNLIGEVWRGDFAIPYSDVQQKPVLVDNAEPISVISDFTSKRLRQRVEETYEMPILPDIARRLLELRVDPDASAVELAEIVEMDPALAAQVISWARSPYYGYSGSIQSVEHAIIRVLGFDLVMNLAVGLAIGKSINVSQDGPLGLKSYWESAINSATLMDKLVRVMPVDHRPSQGLAYLSGLLHNFGYLILGHLFPEPYNLLNRLIILNPLLSMKQLECHVFGVCYEDVGAWLLESWNLPPEIILTVREHNNVNYNGDHANYANLNLLANRLLRRTGIGFADSKELPKQILADLHISESSAVEVFEEIIMDQQSLKSLSRQMS